MTESLDWRAQEAAAANPATPHLQRSKAARALAWRRHSSEPIELTALRGAGVSIVGLPGEPSVEYQIATAAMRPGELVCVAGYGQYAPSYICTEGQYAQGGYEAATSLTSPRVEEVLTAALRVLMH